MYEYWIFEDLPPELIIDTLSKEKDDMKISEDYLEVYQAKNVFVIQSFVSCGDGNYKLDVLLDTLSKYYQVHDKGIIKSHWQTSGFH